MFDQMKNLKQLAGLLGNTSELRERFEQMQRELESKTVTADAGAGAVRVTANGKMRITAVELDPAMIAVLAGEGEQADREMIEQLVLSATNEALERAQELVRQELTQATGGLNLPGMDQLLGS